MIKTGFKKSFTEKGGKKMLELYGASLGEIYDIVVEDMDGQARGLKG